MHGAAEFACEVYHVIAVTLHDETEEKGPARNGGAKSVMLCCQRGLTTDGRIVGATMDGRISIPGLTLRAMAARAAERCGRFSPLITLVVVHALRDLSAYCWEPRGNSHGTEALDSPT